MSQRLATILRKVTIDDMIAAHGPRVPGPDSAQRDFRIGLVAESHNRPLTPTEMTFYEILAANLRDAAGSLRC